MPRLNNILVIENIFDSIVLSQNKLLHDALFEYILLEAEINNYFVHENKFDSIVLSQKKLFHNTYFNRFHKNCFCPCVLLAWNEKKGCT